MHFYRTVPPVETIVLLQLLVRGPLFTGLIYLMVRALAGEHREKALWAGATMSIVGGIAPLLIPNGLFADEVRWAHLVEVAVSNTLFGMAAAWILRAPRTANAPHLTGAGHTPRRA